MNYVTLPPKYHVSPGIKRLRAFRYPSAEAVPCAEAVTLISGNRACKLVMPDIATTLQYLLNEEPLPNRIPKASLQSAEIAKQH
jgi:hypothetical protein